MASGKTGESSKTSTIGVGKVMGGRCSEKSQKNNVCKVKGQEKKSCKEEGTSNGRTKLKFSVYKKPSIEISVEYGIKGFFQCEQAYQRLQSLI